MRNARSATFGLDIDRILAMEPFDPEEDDLSELVEVVLEHVGRLVDVAALENRIVESDSVNFDRVRSAVECFAGAKSDVDDYDAAKDVNDLRRSLPTRKADQAGLVARVLLLATGHAFERLLLHAREGADLDGLHALLHDAFGELPDGEVGSILQKARWEFDTDRTVALPEDDGTGFRPPILDIKSVAEARGTLPDHIVNTRPTLQRLLLGERSRIPVELPALGTLLGVKTTKPARALDRRLFRCLTAIFRLWATRDHGELFAALLGIDKENYVSATHEVDAGLWRRDKPGEPKDWRRSLLTWLRRLLDYSEAYVDWASPEEAALRAYKAGTEVQWEPTKKHGDLDPEWHEERFQRHAIRFLVERGVEAFGTKFGSSQPDIRVDAEDLLLVEVKVYKKKPSGVQIRKNLGQLLQYMDQQAPGVRGVLVVYNFSCVPLLAPKEWIGNQYLILALNLCDRPPSKITTRYRIRPGDGTTIEVDEV